VGHNRHNKQGTLVIFSTNKFVSTLCWLHNFAVLIEAELETMVLCIFESLIIHTNLMNLKTLENVQANSEAQQILVMAIEQGQAFFL